MALVLLNSPIVMGLPFLNRQGKKRDQVLVIDLGGRTTKAVQLQSRGDRVTLGGYAVVDAPIYEKTFSPDVLTEHLKIIQRHLGPLRTKAVALAIGVNDSIFRQIEMPLLPIGDLRQMLKFNSKNYLQQDLPDYVFDCYYVLGGPPVKPADNPKPSGAAQKHKVLVGGARRQMIDGLQTAVRTAGLVAEEVVPAVIGPANAFELGEPELFAKEVVGLVDIGFKNSTITILDCGQIMLNRVVSIGGDRLTSGLAEALGISYLEAESIKVGMPSEVAQNLEPLINPLGRELRASIDFFEHQQDKSVSQVFISGGSARSEFIIAALQAELIVPCKSWNPARSLGLDLDPQKLAEIEQTAPQLAVAIGAGLAALN